MPGGLQEPDQSMVTHEPGPNQGLFRGAPRRSAMPHRQGHQGLGRPHDCGAAVFQSAFIFVFMPGFRATLLPVGPVPLPR